MIFLIFCVISSSIILIECILKVSKVIREPIVGISPSEGVFRKGSIWARPGRCTVCPDLLYTHTFY